MAMEVLLPLKARLKPTNDRVPWKYLPLRASTDATTPAVTAVRTSPGLRCRPRAKETGNNQMSFWSCARFGTSFNQETGLSGKTLGERVSGEGLDAVSPKAGGLPGSDEEGASCDRHGRRKPERKSSNSPKRSLMPIKIAHPESSKSAYTAPPATSTLCGLFERA